MTETERTKRDTRELAQAIATLEVVFTGFAFAQLAGSPAERNRIVGRIRALADRAVFERDGLEPSMLDRIADYLDADHQAAS